MIEWYDNPCFSSFSYRRNLKCGTILQVFRNEGYFNIMIELLIEPDNLDEFGFELNESNKEEYDWFAIFVGEDYINSEYRETILKIEDMIDNRSKQILNLNDSNESVRWIAKELLNNNIKWNIKWK